MSDQNKDDLRKQHIELAKGLARINNPKSPEDKLLEQVLSGHERNSARDKDRKRFFGK